jgi:phenylalanyl-tRNA synthetase beta chain
MDGATMQTILERLGFEVVRANGVLSATVPWWRDHDIEDGRDLVEEIARVYGYANMPPVFPAGISPVPSDPSFAFEARLRRLLKGFGATETMGYSFVSRQELEKTGLQAETTLKLQNPLSQDHEFMRPSLIPSMLAAVVENQERAHELRLFELSRVYHWNPAQAPLPEERERLAIALVNGNDVWAEAKGMAEAVLQELGISGGSWSRVEQASVWHPGRSIEYRLNGEALMTAGELHPKMAETWKIDVRVGLVDGDVEALARHAASAKAYQPLPQFPSVERDLALVVPEQVTIGSIQALFLTKLDHAGLLREVTWLDTYRGKGLEEGKKSETIHLVFRATDRTLSSEDVDALMTQATELAKRELGAVIRGSSV